MKKQEYVSPEMEIVEIKTQCILALSGGADETGGFGGQAGEDDNSGVPET